MNLPSLDVRTVKQFSYKDINMFLIFDSSVCWRVELLTGTNVYRRHFDLKIFEITFGADWDLVWHSEEIPLDNRMTTSEFSSVKDWRYDDAQIYRIWLQLQADPVKTLLRLKAIKVL